MSGQQIGSAVGFVVGFFLPGGPAVWSAIGGAIGGWISPTQVNGPRIGDGANQSSAEGQPIPWILGTSPWIQGNIVDKSPRREVKKTDDGKGSGQEINTFEAHQDFCIMICESSEHRESVMVGPLIVKVDGKIVYDMRPDKDFGAENAKFLDHHQFYDGHEAQMPDPTCEAFPTNGVGNTPYYRGVYTMVARDINLTQYGDRIPLYEFIMVGAGENVTTVTKSTPDPVYSRFDSGGYPLMDSEEFYLLSGFRARPDGTTLLISSADDIGEMQSATENLGYGPAPATPTNYAGFLPLSLAGTPKLSQFATGYDITDDTTVWIAFQDRFWLTEVDGSKAEDPYALAVMVPFDNEYHLGNDGWLYIVSDDPALPYHYPVGGTAPFPHRLYAIAPLIAQAERKTYFVPPNPIPDVPGFYIDSNGNVLPIPVYAVESGTYFTLQKEVTVATPGLITSEYTKYQLGPVLEASDPNNNQTFWDAAALAAGITGTYGVEYPQLIAEALVGTATTTSINDGSVGLDTAITRICKRGGLTVDDIDVSEIDQQLLGYGILQAYNGADCIRPLTTAFTIYGSEYDGKLRFHKHGEAIEIVVNPDDFIVGSDETDKNTREQEVEYPRLFSVIAIDPTQDYTARPQSQPRLSPDINAIGEERIEVPIVMTPDSQRQLAAIGMKVSWARAQGKREFSVPYATATGLYLFLVAGKPFALEGKRYVAANVRLEDGEIHFEAVYDRQSAYTSVVTATPALPPTPPPSSIGGVTLFAAMNLPRLRSKDSTPGMYIAVDGLLDSWSGCALQMSIDDEASWTTAIGSMTESSVMGYLTAPIDEQPTSTLSVSVNGEDLNTITNVALANGGNASAVLTNEVAELLQFQTSDEIDTDKYNLTDLVRGELGTTAAAHVKGDRFVELSSVYFLPLDISLAGRVIKFRPVTFGTPPESNAVYSVTFNPLFTGPQVVEAYVNDDGETYFNETGATYYRIIN
jgi:putative tail protein